MNRYKKAVSFSLLRSSSVSVATSDNNGTFIDTLEMAVFNVSESLERRILNTEKQHLLLYPPPHQDTNYDSSLLVPSTGLELRSRIYVEVKAANLTGK